MRFDLGNVNKDSLVLSLHYRTFLPKEHVSISANGLAVAEYVAIGEETKAFQIPAAVISSKNVIDIELELPDAISPHDLNGAKDKRRLALRLYSLVLE